MLQASLAKNVMYDFQEYFNQSQLSVIIADGSGALSCCIVQYRKISILPLGKVFCFAPLVPPQEISL